MSECALYYFRDGSNPETYTFSSDKITLLVWESVLQDFDPKSCLA